MNSLLDQIPCDPDPVIASCPVGDHLEVRTGSLGLATATYDAGGVYRYRLSRVWDPSGPRCVFAMLNPSTATAEVLDPTVTRCVNFARGWGFGALEVVNVFALRSTDPKLLYRHPDPVGPGNDSALSAAGRDADLVVAAWGVHAAHADREAQVVRLLADAGIYLHCLKVTKAGHPGHPLYLPSTSVPRRWDAG